MPARHEDRNRDASNSGHQSQWQRTEPQREYRNRNYNSKKVKRVDLCEPQLADKERGHGRQQNRQQQGRPSSDGKNRRHVTSAEQNNEKVADDSAGSR